MVNPLRDHHVGWATVTEVDLADLLRVHCQLGPGRTKAISRLGGALFAAPEDGGAGQGEPEAAREASGRPAFGLGSYGGDRLSGFGVSASGYGRSAGTELSTAEADAERIVGVLRST